MAEKQTIAVSLDGFDLLTGQLEEFQNSFSELANGMASDFASVSMVIDQMGSAIQKLSDKAAELDTSNLKKIEGPDLSLFNTLSTLVGNFNTLKGCVAGLSEVFAPVSTVTTTTTSVFSKFAGVLFQATDAANVTSEASGQTSGIMETLSGLSLIHI